MEKEGKSHETPEVQRPPKSELERLCERAEPVQLLRHRTREYYTLLQQAAADPFQDDTKQKQLNQQNKT